MRRHAVRFVLAIAAITMLTACADLPTGPDAPKATAGDLKDSNCGSTQQGSQTC